MRLGEEIPLETPDDELKRSAAAARAAGITVASVWCSRRSAPSRSTARKRTSVHAGSRC